MAGIALRDINKLYDSETAAVRDLNLEIEDGEFMVLVGPSGCGKTTVLRMVAGLETITSGELRIGDAVVNDLLPRERDISMVFQNYALFPHMSVFQNMAFGLQLTKMPKQEIRRRVEEAARTLDLEAYLKRKPKQLSGGQRQRVAMGRAIVRRPQAFLMDEPLSNLDAKLRVEMRAELSRLQREVRVTTIYVTHDQVEAMTMGDRVAVLRRGVLQQAGPPMELFERPANIFVAGFIGSPAMNLTRTRLQRTDDGLTFSLGSSRLEFGADVLAGTPTLEQYVGRDLILGLRPQAFQLAALHPDRGDPRLRVEVTLAEVLGTDTLVRFMVDTPPIVTDEVRELAADVGAEEVRRLEASAASGSSEFVARLDPRTRVRPGDGIELAIDRRQLHFFDPDSGIALETRWEDGAAGPAVLASSARTS